MRANIPLTGSGGNQIPARNQPAKLRLLISQQFIS
jgi:hypothetical protein